MNEYDRYINYLEAKYGTDPLERYYEGDCVVLDVASKEENEIAAELWLWYCTDGERELC